MVVLTRPLVEIEMIAMTGKLQYTKKWVEVAPSEIRSDGHGGDRHSQSDQLGGR